MKPTPIIGILGGMGPYASVRCYQLFLEESRYFSSGRGNHDFPHLLLDNIPVRDLTDDLTSLDNTITQVRAEYLRLRESGATIIIMACNTMHLYLDRIYDIDSEIMHISLIDKMSQHLADTSYKNVGILGSLNTIRSELYYRALREKDINPIILQDELMLTGMNIIIGKIISGSNLNIGDTQIMQTAVKNLIDAGAECIVLGCTELPIAFSDFDSPVPLYDPLIISVRSACKEYYSLI